MTNIRRTVREFVFCETCKKIPFIIKMLTNIERIHKGNKETAVLFLELLFFIEH